MTKVEVKAEVYLVHAEKPYWGSAYASLCPVPAWFEVECTSETLDAWLNKLHSRYNVVRVTEPNMPNVASVVHA